MKLDKLHIGIQRFWISFVLILMVSLNLNPLLSYLGTTKKALANSDPSTWAKYGTDGRIMNYTYSMFPRVIYDGSYYHVWIEYATGDIRHLSSVSPVSWNYNYFSELTGDNNVHEPTFIKDGPTYKMWYNGINFETWNTYTGYRTSSNGVDWGEEIVCTFDVTKAWDADRITPFVIKDGSTYKMYYNASEGNGKYYIAYATSSDGISWIEPQSYSYVSGASSTPNNLLLKQGSSGAWDGYQSGEALYSSYVLKNTGGTYEMWYAGNTSGSSTFKIGYASSSDGISWVKSASNPLLAGSSGQWDETGVMYPSVIEDGSTYKMWYTNNWNGDIGYATADAILEDDITPPTLTQVTAVTTPTNNTTPNYSFNSTEAGTISYDGDCSSELTEAAAGDNTITFNALTAGTYSNCRIKVTDGASNPSSWLSVNTFIIDITSPGAAITYSIDHVVKLNDSLTITATFNEAVKDSPNPKIAIDYAGTGSDISATNMTKTSSTVYTYSATIPSGNDGTATITISNAQDLAGNSFGSATNNTFTVDNTAPVITFTDDVAAFSIITETVNISVADTNPDTTSYKYDFKWYLYGECDGSEIYENTFVSGTPFDIDGGHNAQYMCVKAVDLAGNISYKKSANPFGIADMSYDTWFNSGAHNWGVDNSKKVVSGDFNGDGHEDMAVMYDYGNENMSLFVFPGNGSNAFGTYQSWYNSGVHNWSVDNSKQVVAGDFNHDGMDDIAIMYDYGNENMSLIVFTSNGTTFNTFQNWFISGVHNWGVDNSKKVVSGDFNHDEYSDIAVMYDYGNENMSLFVFTSTGTTFNTYQSWYNSGVHNWGVDQSKQVVAGDYNSDSSDDIAIMYDYGNENMSLIVFTSNGSNAFNNFQNWFTSGAHNWGVDNSKKVVSGDFNGDSHEDIAVMYDYGSENMSLFVFRGTGSAFNSYQSWYNSGVGGWGVDRSKQVMSGDYNDDGYDEIGIMYDYGNENMSLYIFSLGVGVG